MNKKQQITFGIIAGFILLIIGLILVFFSPACLSDEQLFAIKICFALGGAAFATTIPGIINVQNGLITAGGSLAVFIVIFVLNPTPASNCDKIIEGTVYLGDDYFPYASVGVSGLNLADVITNENGHFHLKVNANNLKDKQNLEFRIKNASYDINKLVTVDSKDVDNIIIKIDKPLLATQTSNPVNSAQDTTAAITEEFSYSMASPSRRTTPTTNSQQPVRYEFCVECRAYDTLDVVRNSKRKCNTDSIYIENYIMGFTAASQERGFKVICERNKKNIRD